MADKSLFESIKSRRSTRTFDTDKPIEEEQKDEQDCMM
mgnify:CR=1 FL=1